MIQPSSWKLVAAFAAIKAAAAPTNKGPTFGAWIDDEGITNLYGNSFGRPGYNETFDYIIVGGGNAGNTIAARLALDPAGYKVAVVEAGNFYEITDGNRTQVPGYNYVNTIEFPLGQTASPTLWSFKTTPQPGFGGRVISYPQGMTLGGSSAANYMGYHRPTVGTFDQWAELTGDSFWKWRNVYPAFKKSVSFQPPDYTKIDPSFQIDYDPRAFSPSGGPLHVSYGNYQGEYGIELGEALRKSGFPAISGFNSGNLLGYGTATATIDARFAVRDSSETSFLQAAAVASDIKIYPQTLVSKVLFDENKKAIGVQVHSNQVAGALDYVLKARKEVILSAGVWQTPKLLMLSGVGPAATLRQHGIPVVADVPAVGQNVWDQPTISLFLNINATTNTQVQARNPDFFDKAMSDYFNNRSGPLSGFGTGQGMGFEKFPAKYRREFSRETREYLATFPADWPETEYLPLTNVPLSPGMHIGPEDNFIIMNAVLLSTSSFGNMTLRSANWMDPPVINPNWLSTEGDMEQMYAAFMRMREIVSNWSSVQAEISPGPGVRTKEQIIQFIRDNAGFIYHGTSTAKMGKRGDPNSVSDSRARVFGVKGLRVVDASAFPTSPPGHPMSSIYMFAEKIAESILRGN